MKALLAVLFTLSASLCAQAGNLYKWVDENGVTVYSQTAPPAKQVEKVAPPPPPATSPEAARAELDAKIEKMDAAKQKQEEAATEAAKENSRQEQISKACESARQRLTQLNTGPPRFLLQEADGTTRRLSYEEQEKLRAEAQEQVDKYCTGK